MDLLALGLVLGMSTALLAVGLVLVHMSSRVINFAQGEIGAFAVAMMITMTARAHWPYWPALAVTLLATAVLGAVIERTIIQRLFDAPRLIALLATVGIAQIVLLLRLLLPKPERGGASVLFQGATTFPLPFHSGQFTFGRVVFGPQHILVLIGGPILAFATAAFLTRSTYGLAVRAAAENAPRARLMGIPVRRVSTLAWVVAALLAGGAFMLLAPINGYSSADAIGLPLLLRGLAAATLAGFGSVGLAFGWGLGIGLLDSLIFYYTKQANLSDAVVLGVVLVALLIRREARRRTTAGEESSWRLAEPVRALPSEITAHPRWRALVFGLSGLGAAGVLAAPLMLSPARTYLLATIFGTSIVVLALTILTGWSGQVSLGHWGIAGVAGIFGSRLVGHWGMSFWLAFLVVAVLGGLTALLIGLPALRLPGTLLAVVTLGFAVVSESWLYDKSWFKGDGSLVRPEWVGNRTYYYLAAGVLLACVLSARALQRGRLGRNLVAIRDNPAQAAAFGIAVVRTRLTGFVLSGVLAAIGGFVWAGCVVTVSPNSFPATRSLTILAAAIIGGLGSIFGALLGTAYLAISLFVPEDAARYVGLTSTGLGLLILICFFPGGLARLAMLGRNALATWVTGVDATPRVTPVEATEAVSALTGDELVEAVLTAQAAPTAAGSHP
ncbi:MAG: branched-chain amino acid transport system permease protein livM [Frankiales bacterium]|nr:branched-chain amino acid transport system permease protein livM [Frankiales bacterium]